MYTTNQSPARLTVDQLTGAEDGPAFRLPWRWWSPSAFALTYLAAAALGPRLQVSGAPRAPRWPPSGHYLAALLLASPRRWPALALAAFAANFASDVLLHGIAPLTSVGFCIANATEALAGAWLARRLCVGSEAASPAGFHDRMRGALA